MIYKLSNNNDILRMMSFFTAREKANLEQKLEQKRIQATPPLKV